LRPLTQMVAAIDSPDWVGVAPSGEKTTRDEAEKQLLGLLSIPAGQRPIPLQKIIYVNVSGKQTLVVYWVYRNTPEGNVGSIVRDTWQQTQAGWLRSLHEKVFPDRPLKLPWCHDFYRELIAFREAALSCGSQGHRFTLGQPESIKSPGGQARAG